mmetsp:Transcript_17334/g.25022  ORF Transcript_17334/g.25022 Transcript_17334/m.25022 type:complete len:250 (+) Transcript_17334:92-841(+)|eukprot:CAMPEP_0202470218 /NCGR_PEP_ID=MMETSP1360-20130828/80979_1 /ASSEMBLY_ACC=CAM_ASM_000848 /TAXON_ID=515479 /ORGANISM="Licmophora paradoxa, Strain CCMP2313" /LENGTH=249 /DNA_ID=CAMNT_0049095843 /DNA_START=71 /DNA_END=820 /DNA_ORIENTATION=+
MTPSLRYTSIEANVISCLLGNMKEEQERNPSLMRYNSDGMVNELDRIGNPQTSISKQVLKQNCTKKKNSDFQRVVRATIFDQYGDEGLYTGELVKSEPHGKGKIVYKDGKIYEGEWFSGQYHGQGRTVFTNGDTYEGDFWHDAQHGYGVYTWKDQRQYKGGFINDRREGYGVYTWPDSSRYEGEFKDGIFDGVGCFRYSDGSSYIGKWRSGSYYGKGKHTSADGSTVVVSCSEGPSNYTHSSGLNQANK